MATPNFEFPVTGFDGRDYRVGVLHGAVSIHAGGEQLGAPLRGITPDQQRIMGFVATNTGTEFRPADTYPHLEDGGKLTDRFNAAVLDDKTGLYTFVTGLTGADALWWRGGKDHQVGVCNTEQAKQPAAAQPTAVAQVESSPIRYPDAPLLTPGDTDLLRAIFAEFGGAPTSLDDIAATLGRTQLTLGADLRRIARSLEHSQTSGLLVVSARGKGRHRQEFITIGDPREIQDPIDNRPAGQPDSIATAVATENTTSSPHTVTLNREPCDPANTPPSDTTTERSAESQNPYPGWARKYKDYEMPPSEYKPPILGNMEEPPEVTWDFAPQGAGIMLNEQLLPLHPLVTRLLHALRGERDCTIARLAIRFNGGTAIKPNEYNEYFAFVVWAGLVFDHLNLYVPIVQIDNQGHISARGSKTLYALNTGGWDALRSVTPGRVKHPSGLTLPPYEIIPGGGERRAITQWQELSNK